MVFYMDLIYIDLLKPLVWRFSSALASILANLIQRIKVSQFETSLFCFSLTDVIRAISRCNQQLFSKQAKHSLISEDHLCE